MFWLASLLKLSFVARSLAAVTSAESSISVDRITATQPSVPPDSTSGIAQTTLSSIMETKRDEPTQTTVKSSADSKSAASASSPTSAASSTPNVHLVKAGVGGFVFEPDQLNNVSVGDIVTFEFYPPDHSVARAEFGSACVPYEYTGKSKVGFWSGTQWVNSVHEITHWNLTINSTEPIFYYCAAPDSCKGKQMIGVINPNTTQTLDAQMLAAARADFQVAPGEPVPREGSDVLQNSEQQPSKLSTGAIVGIAVGCVAFFVICALLLGYVLRHRSHDGEPMPEVSTVATANPTPFRWLLPSQKLAGPEQSHQTFMEPVELPGQDPQQSIKY